jgi:hypothetical protein
VVITANLVTLNLNYTFFEIYAFITSYLPSQDGDNQDKTIMMGSNWMQIFSWIPNYIFDKDHDFKTFKRFIGSAKEPTCLSKKVKKFYCWSIIMILNASC